MSICSAKRPKFVYAIQHNHTGRIYVGASFDVDSRVYVHFQQLKNGNHTNELMQEDVNNYGLDFDIRILDIIRGVEEYVKERDWMDRLNTGNKEFGYNYKDNHFKSLKTFLMGKEQDGKTLHRK